MPPHSTFRHTTPQTVWVVECFGGWLQEKIYLISFVLIGAFDWKSFNSSWYKVIWVHSLRILSTNTQPHSSSSTFAGFFWFGQGPLIPAKRIVQLFTVLSRIWWENWYCSPRLSENINTLLSLSILKNTAVQQFRNRSFESSTPTEQHRARREEESTYC